MQCGSAYISIGMNVVTLNSYFNSYIKCNVTQARLLHYTCSLEFTFTGSSKITSNS